jgi:drug/metabolite transporter superfamily protein YnfA
MSWTWLSEDPWPLAGTFVALAAVCLILLKTSQQGKYLAWAGAALGGAGLVLLVEWLWVTDRERIEMAVYDMADAVKVGDVERFESHLAPEFEEDLGTISKLAMRGTIRGLDFEFVRVTQLEVQAGRATRMGKADFLGHAQWAQNSEHFGTSYNAVSNVGFSLGFREVEPDVWKVTRIDVTRAPFGISTDSISGYMSQLGRGM